MKIVLIDRLFARERRIEIKVFYQRYTAILNDIGLAIALGERLIRVQFLSSILSPSPYCDPYRPYISWPRI